MKKLLAILALAIFSGFMLVPAVSAKTATPPDHYTCHHGASGKDCRPDPQPSHGRDCDHPHFGINQDHCAPGSTPSPTPTPTETPKCSVACSTPTPTPQTPHQKHVAHLANTPLAVTGVGDYAPVLILGGIVLIALGAALVSYKRG